VLLSAIQNSIVGTDIIEERRDRWPV